MVDTAADADVGNQICIERGGTYVDNCCGVRAALRPKKCKTCFALWKCNTEVSMSVYTSRRIVQT